MAAPVPYELTKTDRAAWREMLGTPNREKAALAAVLAALQMLVIPLSENTTFLPVYFLLTLGFFYLLTRSLFSLCGVAIPAFFIYSAFGFFCERTEYYIAELFLVFRINILCDDR